MPSHEPALVAVAHGSKDPRHRAVVMDLIAAIRAARPDLRVQVAFLDHCLPALPQVIASLAEGGVRRAVALPLLLTPAYHANVDLPRLLRRAYAAHPALTVIQAGSLGPHRLLVDALERRLREAGIWPGDESVGVVLGAAGTSDIRARQALAEVARAWAGTGWAGVECAYAAAGGPDVLAAATALRRRGARQVVLAPHVLAPGILPDRLYAGARRARLDAVAQVIGAAPEVVALTIERHDAVMDLRASA